MENLDLGSVKSFVDTLWVIDCAILVFIMQACIMKTRIAQSMTHSVSTKDLTDPKSKFSIPNPTIVILII